MNKVINEDNVEIESVVNEEVEIREEQVINQTMENENKANEEIDDSVNKESMNVVMDKCGGSNGVTDGNMNGSKMDNANEGNGIGRMSDENVELDERSPCRNDCSHEQTSTVNQSGNVKSGDVKKTASYELNYHLFRMWGKYGLRKITSIGNGNYVFKFNNENNLQTVIENDVWIVNNKPMVVQKWDINVDINKLKFDILPIWIKLVNLPLDAWTMKGLGYARVLVEVEAKKGLLESINIQYYDKEDQMTISKTVKEGMERKTSEGEQDKLKFEEVRNRKNNVGYQQQKVNHNIQNDRKTNDPYKKNKGVMYRVVNTNQNQAKPGKESPVKENKEGEKGKGDSTNASPKSVWKVQDIFLSAIKRTANKYAVLQEEGDTDKEENSNDEWMKSIDRFIATKQDPPISVSGKWNDEMVEYYKRQRNKAYANTSREMNCEEEIELDENDVFIDKSANAKFMSENERLIGDNDWILMGDMNGILNTNEHSEGSSYVNQDMRDFQDYVNEIEVKDLCSAGLQFTSTKSLRNPNASVLKKLDRVMCNDKFLTNHNSAYVNFLPYGISNHSLAILICPRVVKKTHKAFRLANYITEKEEFGNIVKDGWKKDIDGHAMF
ncbi:zinc knuckle CX2CX4HX4C containing protein [Tanacetum coccineum]|uniref:Zinc knuckle CX2CX4HX4C containing protein n=1 Tax=Tanacetum coccineum TaxID=301880 RepID=A0ABQ5E7W4_9ASTR